MERVYKISEYNTIRFGDEISELGDEFVTNLKAIDLLRYLQMVNADLAFERYKVLSTQVDHLTMREKISKLIEERANTMEELKTLLQQTKEN